MAAGQTSKAISPGECEIINIPNVLARKVGPGFKVADALAVARAEGALKKLSANFGDWLEDEVHGLEQARLRTRLTGLTEAALTELKTRALDLKGLGATYERPLVARIGGSLFKLLDVMGGTASLKLVDAHVDAARAIVRNKIQDEGHPVGKVLVSELERQVAEAL